MIKGTKKKTNRRVTESIGLTLDNISFYTRKRSQHEQHKSSLFTTWMTDAVRLFRILWPQDWDERKLPRLNSFTKKLVSDRKITQASGLVSKMVRQWEGDILGCRAGQVPIGKILGHKH